MASKSNEYAFEAGRISTATVTSTSSPALATDAQRRYALLCNTGTIDCFLAIGVAAQVGKGIFLKAGGGAYEILAHNLTHAAVNAITASGTTTLSIQEGI